MEEDGKFTIGFHFIDEVGSEFSAESRLECFTDLGDTLIDLIGQQLNSFLRQCTFFRKNDYIFMEDLTEEELWAVNDFLFDYRARQECQDCEGACEPSGDPDE